MNPPNLPLNGGDIEEKVEEDFFDLLDDHSSSEENLKIFLQDKITKV